MLTTPTAFGAEFRQDVIEVARKGEAPLAQIAKDFGLSVTTLKRWIAIADRKESGAGPAVIDRRESGETDFHESFPSLDTAPVRSTSGSYDLTIFVDRCSVEVFAQGGLVTMTELIFPAKTSTALSVYATGGTATIDNLQVTQLA
jgi:sucrose-6-phosphate hydrolase SacC (GH32 family)